MDQKTPPQETAALVEILVFGLCRTGTLCKRLLVLLLLKTLD